MRKPVFSVASKKTRAFLILLRLRRQLCSPHGSNRGRRPPQMATRGRTAGYQDLNRINRANGNIGQHPLVVQEKALQLCQRSQKRGAVLSVGMFMTKKGQFCLTLALLIGGAVIQSPSLEA